MSLVNGDDRFSEVIKKESGHLVLGAFSDPSTNLEGHSTPLTDLCLATLFARSYQSFYWRKESIPVLIIDPNDVKKEIPSAFRKAIPDYVTQSEVQEATQWFIENRSKSDLLTQSFADMGNPFPTEAYPGLATLWINDIYDMTIDLLQPASPELANREGVDKVFSRFATTFTEKEKAELGLRIRQVAAHYCSKFMTDQDDLWSLSNYQKIWGNDPCTATNFNEISWQKVGTDFQAQHPEAKSTSLAQARDQWMKSELVNSMASVGRLWTNIPLLGNQTLHSGTCDTSLDSDGTTRRAPLVKRLGDAYMPSLALKAFMLDQNLHLRLDLVPAIGAIKRTDSKDVRINAKYLKRVELLNEKEPTILKIPADSQGNTMIKHCGGESMFAYIRAADVLSDSPMAMVTQQKLDRNSNRWYPTTTQLKKKIFLKIS